MFNKLKILLILSTLLATPCFAQSSDINYDVGGVANPNWRDPVDDAGGLPTINNNLGDARVTNDDQSIYIWDGSNWILASSGGGGGAVTSVNGQTGAVSIDTDNVAEGVTNLYYTDARARAALSGTAPISYNSGSGAISVTQASGVSDGYLSSTDFNLFTTKMSNPMTTVGDIIYAGSGGTPQRLAACANGELLSYALGIPSCLAASSLTTITDGTTPTSGFGADEILFSDGSVVRGNSKFTYNPTTNLFQVTDGTDRFLRISAGAKTFAIGDLDGAGPYIESSLSGNLLQLVADTLELGGLQYEFPAVPGTAGQILAVDSVTLGVATLDWITPPTGSVTSVALSLPNIFSVSGSPVTTSGTLTGSLANQNANLVFAGPSAGGAAQPSFRSIVAADLPSLSGVYLPIAGGTMTGSLILAGAPTVALEAATKAYVDATISGFKLKETVQAATTANITLSGAQTIDGYSAVATDRILVQFQTSDIDNGIYEVAAGAWSRTADYAAASDAEGTLISVLNGATYGSKILQQFEDPAIVGTDGLNFSIFSNNLYIADGLGLELTGGNTFALELDGSSLSKSSAGLRLSLGSHNSIPYFDASGNLQSDTGKLFYDETTFATTFFDANGNPQLSLDGAARLTSIGDSFGAYSEPYLTVNTNTIDMFADFGFGVQRAFSFDGAAGNARIAYGDEDGTSGTGNIVNLSGSGFDEFTLEDGSGRAFRTRLSRRNTYFGDIDSAQNSFVFTFEDQNRLAKVSIANRNVFLLDVANETYALGRLSGGNVTNLSISDTNQEYTFTKGNFDIDGIKMVFPTVAGTAGQVLAIDSVGGGGELILEWASGGGGGGISSLNGLTGATQTFTTGTAGSSFNISSVGTVHTFNQPAASTSAIGTVTTGAQIFAGAKGLNSTFVVGANTSTPSTGAILEVSSTSGFFLPPRMTTAQKVAIASGFPTAGSIVFDTDLNIGQFWTGATWNSFGLAATSPVSGTGTNRILFTDATGGGQLQSSGNFKWDNASGAMGVNFSAPGGAGIVVAPPTAADHNLRLTLANTQTGDRIQLRNADNFTQTGRLTVGGLWQLPTGSATTPTYSFDGDANTGIYRTTTASVGIATNGALRMTVNNNGVNVTNLLGSSGAPTVAAGTGAGTGPTIALSSQNNMSGVLTLTTGTTPAASATVATITFSGTLSTAPECTLSPADDDAAALSGASTVYISATTTTTATVRVLSTNLAASTQYIWNYFCRQ